jgi:Holliday junction resolvase
MNIGKRLESWVAKNGRETEGLLLFRFNDSHSFGSNLARHRPPFDFIGIIDGQPIGIECKRTAKKTFPRSQFDEKQIDNLKTFESHGGIALLVVVVQKTIHILTPSQLPDKGDSLKLSPKKIVWNRLNLKELIDEQLEK